MQNVYTYVERNNIKFYIYIHTHTHLDVFNESIFRSIHLVTVLREYLLLKTKLYFPVIQVNQYNLKCQHSKKCFSKVWQHTEFFYLLPTGMHWSEVDDVILPIFKS